MSFGFSVGDFLAVIELANKLRKDFISAPDQFQHISNDLRNLDNALRDIDVFVSAHDFSQAQEKSLHDITDNCRLVLQDTEKMLKEYTYLELREGGIRGGAKRVWKRLKWEPDDVRDLRGRITSNITSLNSFIALFTADNVVSLVKGQDQQEHQEILNWLTPIDYSAQQSDFIRRRQAGTGQWLLDSEEYQHWVAEKKRMLFCPGIPGAGKTILASIVVENLCNLYPADKSVGICYVYCNFRREGEQKLEDLLASLLKQLTQAQPALPEMIKDLYEQHKARRTRPSLSELCQALHSTITGLSRVFVVVDALDECQVSDGCRPEFISQLLSLWSGFEANIFATSRFIPEITSKFNSAVFKEIRAHDNDIGMYLDSNISRIPGVISRNADLQDEIKQSIIQCVDGMFLLAQLHLDSLRGKPSRKAVRVALSKLAQGSNAYDTAYDDAMDRIKGQISDQQDLAFRALSWIACAKRPLATLELRHALGVELNEPEFDEDNIPELEDVVSACWGLVTVDEKTNIIRLVHYTTQEYFERTHTTWFPNAQSEIMKTCVTYLSLNPFESGMCATDSEFKMRLSLYPLYDYASHYWGNHAQSASNCQYCSTFLKMDSKVRASSQALFAAKGQRIVKHYCQEVPKRTTGLHLAAYFGLYEAAAILLEYYEVMRAGGHGRMPASFAAGSEHGHVTQLPHKSVGPNTDDGSGKTPLIYASENGHEPVAHLLLENGAEIDSEYDGRTPLSYAAQAGHEAVVRLLLEKGAEIDWEDKGPYDRQGSPVSYAAAEYRHEVISNLFRWQGVDVDSKELSSHKTPLLHAAEHGHEGVVRLLIEKGANVDSKSTERYSEGQTALMFASKMGYEGIANLLLENGADVNLKAMGRKNAGETALSYAAEGGDEAVVRLLLKKGADIESKAIGERYEDMTALSIAAYNRHEAVVRLLLEGGAEIESRDDAISPLYYAAQGGHEAVVRLLLKKDAQVGPKSRGEGYTYMIALSIAASRGYEAVVRLLLEEGAEIESGINGTTPLCYAAEGGHEAVVKLLLQKGADIESKAEGKWHTGKTALSFAALRGHKDTVQLLLGNGADIDVGCVVGTNPLALAANEKHWDVVRLLIQRGARVISDIEDLLRQQGI